MHPVQMILCMFFLALSTGSFVISCFQFKEKGFLFNNAYLWATQEGRKRMDGDSESKKPYYRQSGFAFLFIGMICLILAAYIATGWTWLYFVFILAAIIAVVYAVVSSVKIEQQK